MSQTNKKTISLKNKVGGGYEDFWHSKHRYRVLKGSRSSKKSTTTAQNYITRLMQYPQSNLLVVRKNYNSLSKSCYTQLKWATNNLEVPHLWHCTASPLEITYKPTGQKILFRGLNDPLSITSITVDVGYLNWLWIEEAYEIQTEQDFDTLNESIRGKMPPGLFKQTTLTFNPWNEHHWLKARFFDKQDPDVFTKTTNYKCNEWLDAQDLKDFEKMKLRNPRRYQVAGLGDWGVMEGLVFENWREEKLDERELAKIPGIKRRYGLDFGYTNPTALICEYIDLDNKIIYIYNELYKRKMTNAARAEAIIKMGLKRQRIIGDSASPEAIAELNSKYGLRVDPSKKGADSKRTGIEFLQEFELVIDPRCDNTLSEICNYKWKVDKLGNTLDEPEKENDHLMDALRYANEDYIIDDDWII